MGKHTIRGRVLHLDGSEFEKPWVRSDEHDLWRPRRPLILVNGCFDILTAGHLYLLEAARRIAKGELGPKLSKAAEPSGSVLVSLDSDEMVRAKKGAGRPVLTWPRRASQIQYLGVDHIHECKGDEDFVRLVTNWKPTARVRMEEYRDKPSRIKGVREVWIPRFCPSSTSEVINLCVESKGG